MSAAALKAKDIEQALQRFWPSCGRDTPSLDAAHRDADNSRRVAQAVGRNQNTNRTKQVDQVVTVIKHRGALSDSDLCTQGCSRIAGNTGKDSTNILQETQKETSEVKERDVNTRYLVFQLGSSERIAYVYGNL